MKTKSKFQNALPRTKLLGTVMAAFLMLVLVGCNNEEVITDEQTAEVGELTAEDFANKGYWSTYKPDNGIYRFKNFMCDYYLFADETRNGANVSMDEKNSNTLPNVSFYIHPSDGDDSKYYYIRSMHSNKHRVLDVEGFKTGNGANIHLWDKNNTGNQQWVFEKYSNLINNQIVVRMKNESTRPGASNKYISVSGASESSGANVITWQLDDERDKFWYLEVVNTNF